MTSIRNMIKKLSGLSGTADVSDWENKFIESICEQSSDGDDTKSLTTKQIETIEKIHSKNFA
jgi:hypothetical protein